MVATAIYSVTMVLWKETAFPLYRAMEKRWKSVLLLAKKIREIVFIFRLAGVLTM